MLRIKMRESVVFRDATNHKRNRKYELLMQMKQQISYIETALCFQSKSDCGKFSEQSAEYKDAFRMQLWADHELCDAFEEYKTISEQEY